jgi:hypothetical protein
MWSLLRLGRANHFTPATRPQANVVRYTRSLSGSGLVTPKRRLRVFNPWRQTHEILEPGISRLLAEAEKRAR